jgi:uncharacterized membrane protein (UPF0127 family)
MQQRVISAIAALALRRRLRAGDAARGAHSRRNGVVEVRVEVVSTPEALARGSCTARARGRPRHALRVPEESDHRFWMKNYAHPARHDLHRADGTIVGIHRDATPLSTAPVGVGRPSRYVLEVPGGWTGRTGVSPGQRVELPTRS